jgi:hypothetical protein
MRDGVRLSTDLYFPDGAAGPLPVIVVRTPYGKAAEWLRGPEGYPSFFASHGYVVAVQDCRGRYESEGTFTPGRHERQDGYDTLDWLVGQPWCSGRVGTYGCSYLGQVQAFLAAAKHPNHAAAIIQAAGGLLSARHQTYRSSGYENGVIEFATSFDWLVNYLGGPRPRLPLDLDREHYLALTERFPVTDQGARLDLEQVLRDLPTVDLVRDHAPSSPHDQVWRDWLTRPVDDPVYRTYGNVTDEDTFDVPAIHVNSWYDAGLRDTLGYFQLFQENAVSERARNHQYLIISPTTHCESEDAGEQTFVGARDVGDARLDYWRIYLDWFDYWLKGVENGVTGMPKVQTYLMGRGEWRRDDHWPPRRTRELAWYLTSQGRANGRLGDGRLVEEPPQERRNDTFIYDPAYPVPTIGGFFYSVVEPGVQDQAAVELRQDVLIYTSVPLERELVVTGPVEVVLYVSSSARDTDFTVKLVEVLPDGTAWNIVESIMRARWREGFRNPTGIEPGQLYELRIPTQPTSIALRPGHRLRLEVSSSNFPRFERNLNTSGNNYDETAWVVAENTVHHGPDRLSRVILQVADG